MTTWFPVFCNFLGTELPIDRAGHELPAALQNLNIVDGPLHVASLQICAEAWEKWCA